MLIGVQLLALLGYDVGIAVPLSEVPYRHHQQSHLRITGRQQLFCSPLLLPQ